jgi:hypothetical protein
MNTLEVCRMNSRSNIRTWAGVDAIGRAATKLCMLKVNFKRMIVETIVVYLLFF